MPRDPSSVDAELQPLDTPAPDDWHPLIRGIHGYWSAKRPGPGLLPGRRHLDPVEIPELLPWLWLFDVEREAPRFRIRLLGTKHYEQMHWDPSGLWADVAYPEFTRQSTYPDYIAVGVEGGISYRKGPPAYHVDSGCRLIERIMLPLADDGAAADMILGLTLYFRAGGELY